MTKNGLTPFIWLAYLIVPMEGWGLFHGRPLGGFDAGVLAAVCWLWWARRSLPFAVLAIAALVAKIALGAALLAPRGFDARYYANAQFVGAAEAGTEPADRPSTRTDARLSFGGAGGDDLPVYFLNDSSRFNFYLPKDPARATLPVSVTWEGWLRARRTGLHRIYARTAGAHVNIAVGDGFAADIPPTTPAWVGYLNLKTGFQHIRISLSIPDGVARPFEAGWTVDGREEPFDSGVVFRKPIGAIALSADRLLRAISTAFDLLLCGWLTVGVVRAFGSAWHRLAISPSVRDALAIGWVAVIVDALLFARPFLHKMVTLSGGDDWLAYETRARDIGLHGPWMLGGAAIGHGQPFYQMPFYPYFVAATHWLFGDDLYGVHLAQRWLIGGTVIALWRVTAALFGERVGCAGLLAAIVIVYEKVGPWSGVLLSELIFVPLVCAWALLLVQLGQRTIPSLRSAAGAGAVGGLATLTRSTLMLGWAASLPLVALSLVHTKRAGRTVVALALALMAVTSLATVRNWVVARQFVLVSSYGSLNLFLGNEPPTPLVVPPAHKAAYDRLGFDPFIQTVVEYARQSPGDFLTGWRKRAAYALGSFATLAPERGRSYFYLLVWPVALVGVFLLIVRPPWLGGVGWASLIPLSLALTHFAVLAMVDASTYGDRLLLPFYALLAPYVGVAAFGVHQGLRRFAGPDTGIVIWLAVFAVSSWRLIGGLPELDLPLLVAVLLVWGLCVYGVPRLRASTAAVYGAFAGGLCLWATVVGTADAEHAARMDLLIVLAALSSSLILTAGSRLRVSRQQALPWLGTGITVLTLTALHRLAATAPAMIVGGLVLGAAQSIWSPGHVSFPARAGDEKEKMHAPPR